jgi:cytochrome oxidase Cu insertion factor (SCO1/SenC/PrrC family)
MKAIIGLGVTAAGLLVALALLFTRIDAGASGPDQGVYRGSEPPARILMPDIALQDYKGRAVTSHSLLGRVVLLTFLDAQCKESCPVIAAQVGQTFRRMDPDLRREVTAVAISTDPDEDTAAAVRSFLRRTRAERELQYLTRPTPATKRVWGKFQILSSFESGKDSLHSAPVRIYDAHGVWVSTLHAGVDLTNQNLIHDLSVASKRGGR